MVKLIKPFRIMDFILASFAFILGIAILVEGTRAVGMFVVYLALDKFNTDLVLYDLLDKYGFKKIMGEIVINEDILDDVIKESD